MGGGRMFFRAPVPMSRAYLFRRELLIRLAAAHLLGVFPGLMSRPLTRIADLNRKPLHCLWRLPIHIDDVYIERYPCALEICHAREK